VRWGAAVELSRVPKRRVKKYRVLEPPSKKGRTEAELFSSAPESGCVQGSTVRNAAQVEGLGMKGPFVGVRFRFPAGKKNNEGKASDSRRG